ncbi:MAG: hypothetical protein CMN97_12275 [Synechococcus sp. NAT40]|jgi:hypothetical protein|uniref:hypothetical protein n=1 Tax=Synechococcus sp. MIT S9451 TaxID=3082543 RepID=UPI000C95EE40|nr:hypothetical protein [Synechococcus sp. NAT40]MAS29002.1 hypothetical protein [Synechococcus sp. NAT40]|tara:strand:- start:663 stop:983 length:321 start_codon:yes stop_codon:yes gene_type:complete
MPVSAEAEQALHRFVDAIASQTSLQDQFNQVEEIDSLRHLVQSVDSTLTGAAVIPLDQATLPPKILVNSGVTNQEIPWRLLRCPGGPLVLQMICKKANFAVWIESC